MAASTCKVFVGKLPHTLTEDALRSKMQEYGHVASLFYMADQLQQQTGWAFVTFCSPAEAQSAVAGIDGQLTFEGFESPAECRMANQKPSAAAAKKEAEKKEAANARKP
ncbi:hypothetical protein EAH_00021450 [Eimeria acervulina]|uniref:RRM domain-containing protein n=1 Tax=Eimeria acervulina TaxID=5801 RepID=U6GA04_EIMAC|nr:hypothetical protein EAH_00021450 [Eimeria acervulina]CDI77071.1 hypothetical protein EAH_00021450 [Eimeria acervulina]